MVKRGNWFILAKFDMRTPFMRIGFFVCCQSNEWRSSRFFRVLRTLNIEATKVESMRSWFVFVEMFWQPKKGIANFLFTIGISRARNIMTSLLFWSARMGPYAAHTWNAKTINKIFQMERRTFCMHATLPIHAPSRSHRSGHYKSHHLRFYGFVFVVAAIDSHAV